MEEINSTGIVLVMLDKELVKAKHHLSTKDKVLASIILRLNQPSLSPSKDYYADLIGYIIGQQLSVKAASTIRDRFMDLFNDKLPSPLDVLATEPEKLRSAGLSRSKVEYVRNLAEHITTKELDINNLDKLSDEEIIKELSAVKGIGEWTAHMFLIFSMCRLNVLAYSDLGIRTGIKKLYKLKDLPSMNEINSLASSNNWQPYRSVACLYIWQSLDNS